MIGLYFCVGLQLLLSAWPASGMVLCRAEDGHVAIEIGQCGCQRPGDYRRVHPDNPAPHDCEHHRCTDTVVASPATSSVPVRTFVSSEFRSPPLAVLLPPQQFDPHGTLPFGHVLTDAPPSADRSFRTTVLLI